MQGFPRICETLGEDSQGFVRIRMDCETLGEDLQGFAICEALGEDLQGFMRLWRGFRRTRKALGEDLQGFARLWERICKDS